MLDRLHLKKEKKKKKRGRKSGKQGLQIRNFEEPTEDGEGKKRASIS